MKWTLFLLLVTLCNSVFSASVAFQNSGSSTLVVTITYGTIALNGNDCGGNSVSGQSFPGGSTTATLTPGSSTSILSTSDGCGGVTLSGSYSLSVNLYTCPTNLTGKYSVTGASGGTGGGSTGGTYEVNDQGHPVIQLSLSPCDDGPCVTNGSVTVHNPDSTVHFVKVVGADGTIFASQVGIAPGDTRILGYNPIPCASLPLSAVAVSGSDVSVTSTNNTTYPTNYPGIGGSNQVVNADTTQGGTNQNTVSSNSDGSFSVGGDSPSTYNPNGVTSPIIWSGNTNDSATVDKQGFAALYDATTKGFKLTHSDFGDTEKILKSIDGDINHLTNGVTQGNFTNVFTVNLPTNLVATVNGGTNVLSLTNYASETTQLGVSNLLAKLGTNGGMTITQFTNEGNSAQESLSNSLAGYDYSSTNGASVLGNTDLRTAFPQTSLDDAESGGADSEMIGLIPGYTVSVGSSALDLAMPDLTAGKPIFKWAIILLLAICNYLLIIKGLRTTLLIPQAHTAGTTILGTGVNAASAVVMAAAIVAVAAALPTVFASGVLDALTHISITNPLPVASKGYAFCEHYFPCALLVTAILNHLGFRVFLDFAENVGLGIVKFLVGL